MQLLSQVTTVNVPVHSEALHPRIVEFLQRPEIKHMVWAILLAIGVSQFVRICAFWISSKALAPRDKSTFGMAAAVWAIYLVAIIVLQVALAFLFPFVALLFQNDQFRAWLILCGTALGTFLLIFLIPMKIYVIGFPRAVLFVILALVIEIPFSFGIYLVILRLMVAPQDVASLQTVFKSQPEAMKFMQRLAGQEAPDEIDRLLDDALVPIGPTPPLATREAQVRQLQQLLQARKATFRPNQPPPAEFQAKLTRYKQLLQEVMNERSAPAEPPPGHS
jgi:signal transduction histidine kinase